MASIRAYQTYGSDKYAGFFGYAMGNYSYGYYNVSFCYTSVSHSGDSLSISGAYVNMANPNSGYTTNTIWIDYVYVNGYDIGISKSANGGTSYHNWNSNTVNPTVTVPASSGSCTVQIGIHRSAESWGAQVLYGTLSFSKGSLWNDINAYDPDGNQNGIMFDLTTSDGGSWKNITNEPTDFTKTYGTTATISNIRSNTTGAHYTKNNVTNTDASSFTWTFTTASWSAELYSAWNTYTITYNANGGSGAPDKTQYTYAKTGTTNLSSQTPTRTGYTFKGWSLSNTATSPSYSAGQAWNLNNASNYTLYAVWEINSYYLDLNAYLDGTYTGGLGSYGTADVTVNGTKVGDNVTDYYSQHTYGSSYTISDIRANSGYQYNGVSSGSLSGTIGAGTVSVALNFTTTKPSNISLTGNWTGPFGIDVSWSGTGLNIDYTLYYKKSTDSTYTSISCGAGTSYSLSVAEETTYDIYVAATNAGGTTNSNSLSITTPADQAKIRHKANGVWVKGKTYYKKDGRWVKVKKIYRKVDGQWKIGSNYDN